LHTIGLSTQHSSLASLLRTEQFGREVRCFAHVDSTNALAAAWADEGATDGSIITAEFQAAGRGRMGRRWEAGAGLNLLFSVILRPRLSPHHLSLITLVAGIAVAEVVQRRVSPQPVTIKWPNDVLIDGRKCAGILLESVLTPDRERPPASVILGIGVNVNQDTYATAFTPPATSILLETGLLTPLTPLLADLLLSLEQRYLDLCAGRRQWIRQAYEQWLHGIGQPTTLHGSRLGERVSGTILGISEMGALRLRTDQGEVAFHAGDVTSHPEKE
jgi:BirA family transcriptional regulator, biotin operon repressor / biotin---[acetyl-CoA-carboxylase] ligase